MAQDPDVLVDHATIDDVAGARSTVIGLLVVFGLAAVSAVSAVSAVPALGWLYVLVNRRDWAEADAPTVR